MNFEWDEEKNKENIRKHELDFADAWEIFDALMLTALDTREDYGEIAGSVLVFSRISSWLLSIPKAEM